MHTRIVWHVALICDERCTYRCVAVCRRCVADVLQECDVLQVWHVALICDARSTYRVAKTHRMPYLYRSFSAKEPYA